LETSAPNPKFEQEAAQALKTFVEQEEIKKSRLSSLDKKGKVSPSEEKDLLVLSPVM
jgi:hypothetical protein